MGTPLFRRETRGVKLTESGALLLDEARRILDQVERTKAGVQTRARGETDTFIWASPARPMFTGLFPALSAPTARAIRASSSRRSNATRRYWSQVYGAARSTSRSSDRRSSMARGLRSTLL
jgi:DNA-binding transcriptional LysR family regulator